MAFHYKLEVILRLQRSIEHQEENRLLACLARIAALKTEFEEWEEARARRRKSAWGTDEKGTPGILLQFVAEWDKTACAKEKAILEQLRAAEEARLKLMKIYREARQKREVLESLKQGQESAYVTEQLRRIQQGLDEAHLLRSFYWRDR